MASIYLCLHDHFGLSGGHFGFPGGNDAGRMDQAMTWQEPAAIASVFAAIVWLICRFAWPTLSGKTKSCCSRGCQPSLEPIHTPNLQGLSLRPSKRGNY